MTEPRYVIHSAQFQQDLANALLRARARRRARLAIEDPKALARELTREAKGDV